MTTVIEERPSIHHPGTDIRALRQSRGLRLHELALKLGRSVGFVSQIERGLSQPSIEDLRKLARIFDVPLSLFFHNLESEERERGYVVRADARRSLGDSSSGLVEELLSPHLGGAYEMIRSVFSPGAALDTAEHRQTEEAGYVVEGCFDIEISGRWFHLGVGDSFRFRNEPYRWRNPGDDACVVIWIIAPPVY